MFLDGSRKYPLSDPAQVSELCARKYQCWRTSHPAANLLWYGDPRSQLTPGNQAPGFYPQEVWSSIFHPSGRNRLASSKPGHHRWLSLFTGWELHFCPGLSSSFPASFSFLCLYLSFSLFLSLQLFIHFCFLLIYSASF